MVFYKRKPVKILQNEICSPDEFEVWVMRGTNEMFTTYEKYLERYDWLSQKKFTDAVNGKTGLTFWDAQESEKKSSASIEGVFPDTLRDPILRNVQFSTISRIDELVNHVFEEFKHDFFPGEEVTVQLNNAEQHPGLIREKATFPMIRGADGTVTRPPFARYFVRLEDTEGEECLLDENHIRRDRKMFTKQNLRAFLRNSIQRESWPGAPWLVKEPLAIHYRLPMEIPAHLMHEARQLQNKQLLQARMVKNRRSKTASSEEFHRLQQEDLRQLQMMQQQHGPHRQHPSAFPMQAQIPLHPMAPRVDVRLPPQPPPMPRYPIEDLDIEPRHDIQSRPELKFLTNEITNFIKAKNRSNFTFSGVSMKSMGVLLEIWNTLNVQAEVYKLDSFTFDDFVDAMEYSSAEEPCQLFEEVHCAVLNLFVKILKVGSEERKTLAVKDIPEAVQEDAKDDSEMQDESEISTPLPDVPARSTRSRTSLMETPNDFAASLVEENTHVNRAAEMLGEQSWFERLKANDFENGGWQVIIIGLLHQLCASPLYKEQCEIVLAELAPENEEPTRETARVQYAQLDVNLRLSVLQMLTVLTLQTDKIKNSLEDGQNYKTDIRKRKIEYQKERKIALDQLAAKDRERKIQLPSNMPESPKQPVVDVSMTDTLPETSEINDSHVVFSEDEATSTGRTLRGGQDRKRKREEEAARRERERAEKAEAAKAQSKQTKEFKKLLNEIEQIKKNVTYLEASIDECDDDLREASTERTRVLGKDRYCNRYYWFEKNGQPYAGLPSSSTAHYGYANGRLWVQGPDVLEREGFIERTKEEQAEYKHKHGMTVMERRQKDEGRTMLQSAEEWGFYDDAAAVDQLIAWLDDRGEREKALRKELQLTRDHIVRYMEAYKKFFDEEAARKVEAEEEGATRISTRHKVQEDQTAAKKRCLKWTNSMALNDLGHLHSRPPRPREKKQRKGEGTGAAKSVAVVLSRNGKPTTRQGDRYTFK